MIMSRSTLRLISSALLIIVAASLRADESHVQFNRDIRPILAANCYLCHGPDEKHRKAKLRFDEESGIQSAFAGGPESSEAWRRIHSHDDAQRMPPPASHRELTSEQISKLESWIRAGAPWQGHWSFIPPTRPKVPTVQANHWPRGTIDHFILARLEKEGLAPSSPASRERLLRRVYFDLIGLPPTIEEIDAYLSDPDADAYEKVVNHLLQSQHFGERMALMWMDAARHGDSSVFHADGSREMWAWRDWILRAYNSNMPFDQFTREQLAGDCLPNATVDQKLATGFLRNNATTDEGGAIPEEYRIEYAVDRVKTTSMIWMGLSLECAQCHDHKYDPITQREYYQFFAYFNQATDPGMQTRRGNESPTIEVFEPNSVAQVEQLQPQLDTLRNQTKQRRAEVENEFQIWLAQATTKASDGPIPPKETILYLPLNENQGSEIHAFANSAVIGKFEGEDPWTEGKFGAAIRSDKKRFVDLGAVCDFEHTNAFSYGAWIRPNGKEEGAVIAKMDSENQSRGYDLNCNEGRIEAHLVNEWPNNAIKIHTQNQLKADQWQHVFVTYDGSSQATGVKIYIDGVVQPCDIEQNRLNATIRTDVPLYLGRRSQKVEFDGRIDEVRIYGRQLTDNEMATIVELDSIQSVLAIAPEQRSVGQIKIARNHFFESIDAPSIAMYQQIKTMQEQIEKLQKPLTTVMVMQDLPKPRMTYLLERGNYAAPQKNQALNPGTPAALPPLPDGAEANRWGLAKWLTQSTHPLTARVTVNRYWYMLFGTGLVKTLEDFGSQGEWPSHPGLLDWLAVDFMENGWNVKRTIRQMVLSATYRQTSRVTPELLRRDPENRWLARGPRFRLQAETVRDNALAASGLLVSKIGGPSVKPYQPAGLWNEVSLESDVRFVQDHGEHLYRRSLYTYWKRSAPAPSMMIFDAPTRIKCVLRRSRTNTPLQALVMLNDVQFVESARALAERGMVNGGDSVAEQIVHAYRLATGIRPKSRMLHVLEAAYHEELQVFKETPERAKKLLALGESPRNESLEIAKHAAMSIVASIILNLDETITKG